MKSKQLVTLMLKEGLHPEYRGFAYLKALMELCPLEGNIPPLSKLYAKMGRALGVKPSAIMQGIRLCIWNGDRGACSNRAMIYRLRALLWADAGTGK